MNTLPLNNIDVELLNKYIQCKFTIIDGKFIDVDGIVNLFGRGLVEIPFKLRTINSWFDCSCNNITSLDNFPDCVGGSFYCVNNPNLPYSELFKIVDKVKGNIYFYNNIISEDKDKIRRDRDVKGVLTDDELGNLDV